MKILAPMLLFAVMATSATAQTTDQLTADREFLDALPRIELPAGYETKSLPYRKDNTRNKYFPEVFMQTGWSCNQASSIGYLFTYEINLMRDKASDQPANLYDPLAVWNLLNHGLEDVGVSYYDSWNVIINNGIPSVADYSAQNFSMTQWMSGYDRYYNGMKNRIEQLYAIDIGTPEGLLTLKHWINDHLDGSPEGGVANFQIGSNPMMIQQIPITEEEGGQHIIVQFSPYVGHAMTFAGWNDNVRYDVNGDGRYTNDVDINGDGVVDMRDWEIGAMLVVNSWGQGWGDKGKIWVMYRLLAESVAKGGIWSNSAMVVKARATHQPLLTMKAGLTYDKRDRIKILAGVANNVNASVPEHTIDFTCFSFQGGSMPMQGIEIENNQFIEIGLDITRLLEFMDPGKPVKLFLEILENGSDNSGRGEIQYMSVFDHMAQATEYRATDIPKVIRTRNTTHVGVTLTPASQPVRIVTESLAEARAGSPWLAPVQVTGGTMPYRFTQPSSLFTIREEASTLDFAGGTKILPDGDLHHKVIDLSFDFPFYGSSYRKVTILDDGGVVMGDKPVEYPYVIDPRLTVFQNRGLFPLYTDLHYVFSVDQVTYSQSATSMLVRWRAVLQENGEHRVDFATQIHSDGRIDFHYNYNFLPASFFWISALSNGNITEKLVLRDNTTGLQNRHMIRMTPVEWPVGLTLTDNGVLYGTVNEPGREWVLPFEVTDRNGLNHRKELVFKTASTGIGELPAHGQKLEIWPNPAGDYVHVRVDEGRQISLIEVLDYRGAVVLRVEKVENDKNVEKVRRVDLRGLSEGIYVIRVMGAGGEVIGRGRVLKRLQ